MSKTCTLCKIEKPFEAFCKRARSSDGFHYNCKECAKKIDRKYYENNRTVIIERSAIRQKSIGDAAKEFQREYRKKNPDLPRKWAKKWREANKDKRNADWYNREAKKLQATPAWANHKAIALIYEEAQFATEFFGVPYHVDHIVPLRSKLVCGLHWEGNLQVLKSELNVEKGNRFWPDMP